MSRPVAALTVPLALATLACLAAMLAVTITTGASQEAFEVVRPAAEYAADLRAHAGPVRLLFALDSAFLVLYSAFFLVFGRQIATDQTRGLVATGIGFIFATALLDMVEDHHILAMLTAIETGQGPPTDSRILLQQTISAVKFNLSYMALFLYGLAMPRDTRAGLMLSILLTAGTLVQAVWLYATPPAHLAPGNIGRTLGFIVGLALAIPVARHLALPPPSAAATNVPKE